MSLSGVQFGDGERFLVLGGEEREATGIACRREGYLLKRGKLKGAYTRRWFVLQGNCLLWYTRYRDESSIRGGIRLKDVVVVIADEEADRGDPFVFRVKAATTPEYERFFQVMRERTGHQYQTR